MIVFKKFLFFLIFIPLSNSHALFDINTLLFILKNRTSIENVFHRSKNILNTSKDVINKGVYGLGIGLTGLGAAGFSYLSYNAYKSFKQEKQEEIASEVKFNFLELLFPEQHEKNIAKASISMLISGLGILAIIRKLHKK